MSGGTFNYVQNRLEYEAAHEIQKAILRAERDKDNPESFYHMQPETVDEFRKGLEILRQAYIYLQRIDWLLASDDGEDTFHERLKDDLEHWHFDEVTEDNDSD